MITIPTGELCGLLSDAIPFALADPDVPALACVQLEWDGVMMHALATDNYRAAWSRWSPDDDPDGQVQEQLGAEWGGGDTSWRVLVALADARDVVSTYKLPLKERMVPVSVQEVEGLLRVVRTRDTGHSAITMMVRGLSVPPDDLPRVRQIIGNADTLVPTMGAVYNARWLADFARVRPRGPLEMRFTRGLTRVQIGERFDGAIVPVQLPGRSTEEARRAAEPAAGQGCG